MLFSRRQGTMTTVGGAATADSAKFSMGYLRQIIIVPTTSTNTYNFSIVDEYGFTVLPTQDITTTAVEGTLCIHKVDIPLLGVYTFTIDSATVDEAFSYEYLVQED